MLKKLSVKELVLYGISILIGLIGLVFTILGVVADNLGVKHPLYIAQSNFPWRYLGLIIIAVAIILAIITLTFFAKKVDRITDRELRRKQRLSAMMSDTEKQEEIVVSDGKIVEEKKVTEEKEEEIETKPINEIKPETQVKKEEATVNQNVNEPSGDNNEHL